MRNTHPNARIEMNREVWIARVEDEGSKSRVVGEIRNGEGYYAAHNRGKEGIGRAYRRGEADDRGSGAPRERSSGRR